MFTTNANVSAAEHFVCSQNVKADGDDMVRNRSKSGGGNRNWWLAIVECNLEHLVERKFH